MVKSTTIVRASDALPLAASVDDEHVRVFRIFDTKITSNETDT